MAYVDFFWFAARMILQRVRRHAAQVNPWVELTCQGVIVEWGGEGLFMHKAIKPE